MDHISMLDFGMCKIITRGFEVIDEMRNNFGSSTTSWMQNICERVQ